MFRITLFTETTVIITRARRWLFTPHRIECPRTILVVELGRDPPSAPHRIRKSHLVYDPSKRWQVFPFPPPGQPGMPRSPWANRWK